MTAHAESPGPRRAVLLTTLRSYNEHKNGQAEAIEAEA
jgi:hypothetical protein